MKLNKVNLHQALRGRGLKSVERDVLQAMASYGGYDLTEIKPALETVAKDYGFNIKTVRDAVRSLKAKGILQEVKKGGGRNTPTEYKVETLPTHGSVSTDQQAGNPTVSELETLPSDDGNPTVSVAKPYRPMVDNQSLTSSLPVKRDQYDASASPGSADAMPLDDEFARFFKASPRQVNVPQAKAAYIQAREKVGAEVLFSSVKRFAKAMSDENKPVQFIKTPAKWLDEEKWTEYPEPAPLSETLADVEAWILSQFGARDLDWDLTPRALEIARRNFGKMTKEEMLEKATANTADGLELERETT